MLQKTPKASKGDLIKKTYFNDFGITKTLQNVTSYVFEKCLLKKNIFFSKTNNIEI